MNAQEYKDYQGAVDWFFEKEGITNLSIDHESEEPYFSWQQCDCCGRFEAGDRYDCIGYNPETKEVQEGYSVCTDCVYYVEYGVLDDMTMLEVEESDYSEDQGANHMNTTITLTAEEIAEACADTEGSANRQAIEDAYERQTPPEIFIKAVSRADRWPRCRNTPERRYGLQYAYLLEFLICDEVKRRQMGGVE